MDDFLASRRGELIDTGLKRLDVEFDRLPLAELAAALAPFVDDTVSALRAQLHTGAAVTPVVAESGARVAELLAGAQLSIALVARSIGAISDAVGVLGTRLGICFGSDEYQVLNLCTDAAVAAGLEAFEQRALAAREHAHGRQEAQLAHELNNAIANARAGFDLLRSGRFGIHSRTGDVVERSLRRLEFLAQRSLIGAKLEAGVKLEIAEVTVAEILRDVVADVTPQGGECRVEAEPELSFAIDRALVHSALGNLLQNAIKYSPSDAVISLRARRAGDEVVIEVVDQCGGVPEGLAPRLFEPFERGDVGSGSGLGLAIVRQIADVHGGRVTFENRPPVGCTFAMVLPARRG